MDRKQLGFYRDVFGGWRWEYFDSHGEARDSPCSYDTRAECVSDARRHGLLVQRTTLARPAGEGPVFRRPVPDMHATGSAPTPASGVAR